MDWRAIYDRESPALFSHLLGRGLTRERAEDVVHDVFAAAIAAGNRIEQPRAYLFRAIRRAVPAPVAADDASVPPELAVLEPSDGVDVEAIHAALSALPAPQREVVILRVWHGYSAREIAEALELSEDTVSSRWRYGLEKLKRRLKDEVDS